MKECSAWALLWHGEQHVARDGAPLGCACAAGLDLQLQQHALQKEPPVCSQMRWMALELCVGVHSAFAYSAKDRHAAEIMLCVYKWAGAG